MLWKTVMVYYLDSILEYLCMVIGYYLLSKYDVKSDILCNLTERTMRKAICQHTGRKILHRVT